MFGPKTEALGTVTGTVLTMPSSISMDIARSMASQISMNELMRQLGVITADAVGDLMITKAMKPSDYANLPTIPDEVAERVIETLGQKPDVFMDAFKAQLKNKG